MAGHSHAKNVMHRKATQNKKKSKVITKIAHMITNAVKQGGSNDPETNFKLKFALKMAHTESIPKDVIMRAIENAHKKSDQNLEETIYEGYINGVAILIETITDNKNKTAPEIRAIFNKFGGIMGQSNSVAFMFDKLALVECQIMKNQLDDFLADSLEVDVKEIVEEEKIGESDKLLVKAFFAPENLHKAQEHLDKKWQIVEITLCYIPQNMVDLDDKQEQKATVYKMLNMLEENESTQAIWHNLKE